MSGRRGLLLLGAGALAGCALVDQRTFNPDADRAPVVPKPPPPAVLAPALPGAPPLLSIRLPAPATLDADVAKAVRAARARRADLSFEVVEITSETGPRAGEAAARVARAIVAAGVPAERVRLAARPVPKAADEVRVYVR